MAVPSDFLAHLRPLREPPPDGTADNWFVGADPPLLQVLTESSAEL